MLVRRLSTKPSWAPMTTDSLVVRFTRRAGYPRVSSNIASSQPSMTPTPVPPAATKITSMSSAIIFLAMDLPFDASEKDSAHCEVQVTCVARSAFA